MLRRIYRLPGCYMAAVLYNRSSFRLSKHGRRLLGWPHLQQRNKSILEKRSVPSSSSRDDPPIVEYANLGAKLQPLTASSAKELFRSYLAARKESPSQWAEKISEDSSVEPAMLTSLACHLSYQKDPKLRRHALEILRAASSLGDPTATFCIITNYLEQGSKSVDLPTFKAALERLGIMAKKDANPEAMIILAKFLLSQRQTDEALKWFHQATDRPDAALEKFTLAGHALVEQARIHLSRHDMAKSESLLQRATEVLEDPSAFFYLSAFYSEASAKRKECLTMAAMMGVAEAAHNLGGLALDESKKQVNDRSKTMSFINAREWFELAAAGGFGYSMLNLALLEKSLNNLEAASAWLEKAEKLTDVKEQAQKLKMEWEQSATTTITG